MITVTADDLARFFLSKADNAGGYISNLKLQKLLYYAQGFHLAYFDRPIFLEPINAWQHGPVCASIYHKYKQFGSGPIPYTEPPPLFSGEQKELLDEVFKVFGQFSAWKLRNMTHEETPWACNEEYANEITHYELSTYFKTRLA